MSLGKNIAKLRKEKGWTQNELGERLGVSNQAISKWESEMNMPDVMLLPAIADLFGCYIDELFQRNVMPDKEGVLPLPWEDDDTVRCVVFKGHTKLASEDAKFGMAIGSGRKLAPSTVTLSWAKARGAMAMAKPPARPS